MPTNLLPSLPTTHLASPVIPFAPNANVERGHEWDWTRDVSETPSGLSTVTTRATRGAETIPLAYDGLTRSDARTIEQFVEDRAGRKEGFWCPTFQQDFYAEVNTYFPSDSFAIREWGFADTIYPLGVWARQYAGYRAGAVGGGPWLLSQFAIGSVDTATGPEGSPLRRYGNGATGSGNGVVLSGMSANHSTGLRLMRLLWVRFADDAITTEWAHPNFASIALRVVEVPSESP
jgi:hypothetical protein